MELQSLLSNFNSPKEGLEYLKDRTNNNVNWENLSKASEEIAKNQGGDKDSIALQIIGQYSQGENPLFNFEELKAPPAIQGKDLQKYDTNITSLEGIKNLGLDVIDTLGLTGFSENASKRRQDTMRYLQQSAKDNIPYDNLDEQSYWALSGIKGSAVSRHEYENLKKTQELISKTENDLTQDDKNFINKQLNPISHFFSDYTKEDFEEFKDKATQDLVNADVQSKLNFLNTIHQEKSITSILTGSDEKTKNDYLQAVQTIAKEAGFEGIAYDKKGDVFFYDHENFYKPNQDFFGNFLNILASNAGSIGGGITGAIVGAKNAKNPQQALIGSVVGAGIGSFIGASSDVLLTNARLNRENTLKEVLAHSLEEGTLSVVGDLAIMGGAMAVKNGLKILKDSNVAQKTSETFKNIVEYTPIIGFVSRFQDANAKSALKLISNTIDETQQKALHDFGESFGGNIKFGSQDNFRAYENIKAKFGENHFITKGAKIINDAFMLKSQSQAQKTILQAIRADESGNLVAFLSEAANASPTLQNSLKSLLNQTTFNLKKQLQYLDLKPNEVKEIFDTFQKGTKTEYAQAIDEVLTKVYDDTYKVQIDPSKYNNFRIQLEQSGVLPQDSIRFLEFAQKNIYNQQGVSFTQLNNALKQINSYYKTATDPNFKDFTAKALENFLRDDIKQGIDSIFAQNKTLYKDAQSLFSSALSDYGKMKATLKLVDKIKLRDESISYEQAFKNLYEYVKGQGGELQNLTKLTQHLDKNSAQRVELSILYNLFNQNIKDFKDIQVFDSQAFFKNLESIKDHFNTQSAKDFIDIAKGFDTLFKNDVLIANAIRNATTDKISSSIATTIQGAVKFQLVRMMFENIVRLLPNIPFMSSLNEKVQGASLRFHIKSALMKNLDVQDFKISLSNKAKYNKEFNSQTKQALENIIGKIDKAQDEMLEVAQRNTKQAQNAKDLQEYQTLQKYGVESLQKLSQDDFNHFVDSVLSGDIEALKSAPNIVYIADLSAELAKELGLNNGKIFLRKNDLHHSRNERKGTYNQHLDKDEIKQLPKTITENKNIYVDKVHNNFFITKELNENEIAMFVANKDELGNYVIHIKRVLKSDLNKSEYSKVGSGIEPHIEHSTSITPPSHLGHLPPNAPKMQVHSQAIGERDTLSLKKSEPMHPDTPLENPDTILPQKTNDDINASIQKQASSNINSTLQNPSIEFALQEFPEFSKAELEEMLTKGIRGEARTKEGITKQDIEYFKDNTRYRGEIANYRDEELGMYGDTFHLAKLQKIENVIDPTNWEASLKTLLDKALTLAKDKDTLQQAQDLMKSIHLNNPSFFTPLNPNYPKIKEIVNEYQERLNTLITQSPQDIKFIDTKGKEHTLTKEVQEQWLKTFNLKSLDETYIPNFTPEVKQALDSILQGEQIKLTKGSLLKLMQRDRLEFLPYIKDTLESPQVVVRQVDGALIFAKDFRDDKLGKFFASVSKNDNGEWVISSNAPKNLNNLQNKIKEGGEVLYSDLPELPIIAKPELPAKALNSEANLSAIIPQSPQDIKFIDTKGKEHTLSKDTQEQWLQTFGLQNLEQSYIPKHSQAIQQALGGKEIKLQKGSLLKLVSQGREQYIPQIKEVLDNPEAIIRDSKNAFLFVKQIKDDDYFVNVSIDKGEYLVSISNGFKETNNLQNKLKNGGEIIYQSPNANSNLQTLLQTSRYSANTIDKGNSTTKNTNELEKPTTENYSVVLFSRDNATNEAQLFGNSEQPQVKTKDPTAKEAKNITFIDAKGKEREITKQVQEQWLETFNLKSLDEDFIPQFSDEVRQALNKAGITQDFHLKLGSLLKLDNKQREAFLPYIKPTIEHPNLILDNGKGILFIKEFVDSDKNRYFMSVAKDFNDEWIFSSHTRRELNNINNELQKSKVIYNNGFKGGEVAGASDILESGGTTTKPSDLQITYPANHSSGKNPKANSTTKQTTLETNALDDNKLKEFEKDIQERLERVKKGYSTSIYGTSYDSKGGYVRLLSDEEKHNILYTGYNEKLLDKYLELKNNNAPKDELNKVIKDILEQKEVFEKHEHFKNAQKELIKEEKIKEFDKEAYEKSLENKSENEIKKLYEEIFYKKDREDIDHIKENILSNILYRVPKEAQGDFSVITKIVSLKERVSDRDHYDKNYLRQTREYLETKLNIIPIKEFGTNYAEFYKDGKGAIQKLLSEAKDYETRKEAGSLTEDEVKQGAYKGQVAGAFYKEDLGDIDLVWGEVKGSGKDAKGFGLSKILEKHIDDFKDFVGDTKEAKLVNGINEIIENGKVVKDSNGRRTIVYNDYFKIGLKQNWKGETTPNNWVITAYEDTQQKERDKIIHSDSFTKGETLPLNSKEDSTTKTTNIQNTATQHNPSIPTPQELQIQVSKAKADIDELMKNPQIVDTQWLYRVNKPQEVEIIQAHYFNQEIPQEYQEIIAPFPKLREQEIADTLKQHTQTQLKQAHKEQFLETFKDKPFKKTRIQASNLLKTYYEHNPKGLGVEIKDWNFESANFKMALAKFQTKLKKGDEEVFETLWEAKFAKNIQDKRQEIQNLFSINPIKEFGTNYAEFYKDGKGAIQKLLAERQGQVAGAFHKEGLGDIDLVWGNEKIGLAHILERRTDDFIKQGLSKEEAKAKAKEFVKSLPDIIENGNIDKRIARAFLETQDSKAVIALDFNDKDNKWILTAYNKDDALNPAYSHQVKHNTNTSSETRASGDKEIIPQNANTINILKDMQDKDINVKLDNKELQSEKQGSNSASLTKGETLPLNSKEDSSTKNTKYTIRELKTPSDEELKQITQAYTQDNELLKQRKEIIQSYSNKIEKTKSKKIKQRLEDERLEKLGQINRKIDDDYALFLRKNGVDTKAMLIKRGLEISERYAKPLFDLLEGFSDKELREYQVRYKNIDTYRDSYLEVGDKRFTEGKGLSISTLRDILLTKLNMSEYPKEIQYAYFDSPLFYHARWNKIETKPDSELIYSGGLSFDEMAMNTERKDLEYLFDIKPIKEFGTNYAEFYKDGKGAIQKLLSEAKDYETRKEAGSLTEDEVKQGAYKGQVAGAFYKEGLGDIDLVWGDSKMGLQKIITKHIDDFNDFAGETQQAKLANGLSEIIENGKVVGENGVNTIWYKRGDDYYLVGLSKGFNGIGENEWIITSYEKRDLTANQKDDINSKIQDSDTKALSPVSEFNELQSLNSTINSNSTTKDLIKEAKEQGLSQVQSNTNAQQLTLHDIQERLTARKKELEQQSKDLSTELKTQEKQANRVAPILKELLQKWRALNPLIIEWKERKEIRGKFGQFLGYEKKLSKRKPNLSNLEHIEKTLEAYKSYAKNNEDSAESVKKEISLLEDYVEKLKNKQNIQNLIEHSQSKEQILSDERRKINTYHDLRQNFNKGHHTDLQILEGNNIPQEQHKQLLEFISQTRSYIESNFNINPLKEFGTNYAEFYKDGKGAIQKLLSEAKDYETRKEAGSLTEDEVKQGAYKGQVAGAFYKEGLGDIDLVWGDSKMGLQKIITKHIDDFNDFAGETQQAKLANGLSEIIENGKVVGENGVNTIIYAKDNNTYRVGLSKGFLDKGDNNWIITAYKVDRKSPHSDSLPSNEITKSDGTNLHSNDLNNPTTKGIIKQAKEQDLSVKETKEATQDSTQATQDLTHLKQKLENASDEEKGEIIKEAITEQNNKLLEEITKLQNVLEKKDFLPFEIDEKIKSLSTKSQFIGEDEESLKKVAISQLEFETKDKIKELQKVLKDNKIGLGTLKEFLTKAKDPKIIENKTAYESVKATLKRLIEKNQKRVLKILDNAIQERKLTYYLNTKDGEERGRKLFYSFKPDTEQIELFEKIFPIAQKLGVEVKQAINNEFLSKEADGVYYTQGNSLRVKNNRIYQEKGKVFLHELIHSVTSRAMIAYESGKRELLSPNQIVAINNIQKLYKEVYKNHKELGFETFESFFTGHKGDYGLKNSHEFVAELSNPIFREKLKKVGVFEKLVDNILRLFVSAKEALGLAKTNAYESLKKNLYEIIDNYKDDFSQEYEKLGVRNVSLESGEVKNMLESKVKTQGQSVDIEIPKEKDFFKNLRNNTKKVLSVLKGQVFENINSGMKAQVSSDGINKMISVKAVDKSINNGYTKEEHFASVENVINLYKISKLTQSEKPNNNSVDVIAYHKFIADFSINAKPTKAKITLRETIQAGNRIYSLELLELEKASN